MSKYKPVPEHLKTHTLENGEKVSKARYDSVQKWKAKQDDLSGVPTLPTAK